MAGGLEEDCVVIILGTVGVIFEELVGVVCGGGVMTEGRLGLVRVDKRLSGMLLTLSINSWNEQPRGKRE